VIDSIAPLMPALQNRKSILPQRATAFAMNDGGSVLLNASVVAVTADPGICAYATSKHALVGLMRVAAKEAARRNIRVNVIAPGPIANEFQGRHRAPPGQLGGAQRD
jgi:NAD(P)-dependent dehydrogenase (short-subunit alcohol dehydrogenase family)